MAVDTGLVVTAVVSSEVVPVGVVVKTALVVVTTSVVVGTAEVVAAAVVDGIDTVVTFVVVVDACVVVGPAVVTDVVAGPASNQRKKTTYLSKQIKKKEPIIFLEHPPEQDWKSKTKDHSFVLT